MDRPQKAFAYIVRDDRLVVFTHPDDASFDQSGLQIPGGTVVSGELPEQAVLREAYEETRLEGLRIVKYLGAAEYDVRPTSDAVHVRHYYQLAVDAAEVPERWHTFEHGKQPGEIIRFECYWLPLAQAHVVGAGQAACLGRIFD